MSLVRVECQSCRYLERLPAERFTIVRQIVRRGPSHTHYRYRCSYCRTIQLIRCTYSISLKLRDVGVPTHYVHPAAQERGHGRPISLYDCFKFQQQLDVLTPEQFTR